VSVNRLLDGARKEAQAVGHWTDGVGFGKAWRNRGLSFEADRRRVVMLEKVSVSDFDRRWRCCSKDKPRIILFSPNGLRWDNHTDLDHPQVRFL
jgi:hypothetical protein